MTIDDSKMFLDGIDVEKLMHVSDLLTYFIGFEILYIIRMAKIFDKYLKDEALSAEEINALANFCEGATRGKSNFYSR